MNRSKRAWYSASGFFDLKTAWEASALAFGSWLPMHDHKIQGLQTHQNFHERLKARINRQGVNSTPKGRYGHVLLHRYRITTNPDLRGGHSRHGYPPAVLLPGGLQSFPDHFVPGNIGR